MTNRKELVMKALKKAMSVRQRYNLPLNEPICPFDLATNKLKIDLRFSAQASLEGMYSQRPLTILIGSQRPVGRQTYTCAHEIGHHEFEHGTRVDEIKTDDKTVSDDPDEFLAQVFAGFLLMPKMAIDFAFSQYGVAPQNAPPAELYSIACFFGVGFTSFINHLAYSLRLIEFEQAEKLKKVPLKKIREDFGSPDVSKSLIVAECFSAHRPIDIEIGDILLTPFDSEHEGICLLPLCRTGKKCFWEALKQGVSRIDIKELGWSTFVRVRPKGFNGRAIYRHMADPDDEE